MSHRHIVVCLSAFALILTLFGLTVYAQPNEAAVSPTAPPIPTYPRGFDPASIEVAKQVLRQHAAERSMRPDLADLTVSRLSSDLGIDDVWFQQLYQGIPVSGQETGVHIRKDGKETPQINGSYEPRVILETDSKPYPGPGGAAPSIGPTLSAVDAAARASAAVGITGTLFKPAATSLVVYPSGKQGKNTLYAVSWSVRLYPSDSSADWEVFIHGNTGTVLGKINRRVGSLKPTASGTPAPRNLPANATITATRVPLPSATVKPPQATPSRIPRATAPALPQNLPRTTGPIPQPVDAPKSAQQRQSMDLRSIAAPAAPDSTLIMYEDFESTEFPTAPWSRSGNPTWGTTTYTADNYAPYEGSRSAWCAALGRDIWEYGGYANDMFADLTYGPFDLTDAVTATLTFHYWNESESGYDYFSWFAGTTEDPFWHGYRTSGNSGGWKAASIDLTNVPEVGNLTGRSGVYIDFRFQSDSSLTYLGAFIDDVRLEKGVPNLTVYTPPGPPQWEAPLVASSQTGTYISGPLYSNRPAYVDLAIINNGTAPASNFDVKLYRDGNVEVGSGWHIDNLPVNGHWEQADVQIPVVPLIDSHKLKIVIDPSNAVRESNESDNSYERSFTWIARQGQVFNPNPIVTSGDITLRDNGNLDSPILTAQRVSVNLQSLDGTGYLRGPYVDLTAPNFRTDCNTGKLPGRAYELSLVFDYTRSDDRFEEVMAYYHIDGMERYLQSLGFFNVNNRAMPVHAHCYTFDNSSYSTAEHGIGFGDGAVDDAEDAEIIAHEYGHAIQFDQVPLWGAHAEGRAMGEGFGDYWAASYFSAQNAANFDPCVAEWDGTAFSSANPPCLRRVDSTKHYPNQMIDDPHADGEIWSATLWQIWNALGRATTDSLVVRSHYSLDENARFGEGADAIVASDRLLNSGRNVPTIVTAFKDRGIFDQHELDNTWSSAVTIAPNGASQTHNFHSKDDVDWVRFTTTAWYTYSISTLNLQPSADTVVEVYASDGTTLIASNDDCVAGQHASCAKFLAPGAGTYYARVRPYNTTANTGRGTSYELRVITEGQVTPKRLFLPPIRNE